METEIPPIRQSVKYSQDLTFTSHKSYLWIRNNVYFLRNIYSGDVISLKDRLSSGWQYLPQFSLYSCKTNVTDATLINVLEVIKLIRSQSLENLAKRIAEAQALGDMTRRANLKSTLPYITHSGIFIPRRNDGLVLPGFTYQLDIDKIPNADEILQKVINDSQLTVLFASKSVSGNGVKALLFLKELLYMQASWTHEQYRTAYHRTTDILLNYFKQNYNVVIDTQMKSISQPFYLFHAPDLFIHKNLRKWI